MKKRFLSRNGECIEGLKQRFHHGLEWEETEYYKQAVEKIEQKGQTLSYTSASEFLEQRCRYLDELYNSIKTNGYQRQTSLGNKYEDSGRRTDVTARHLQTHEVSVGIGRAGDLLHMSGKHRFCIARLLNIDEIPVQVLVRHKKWQQIRNQIHDSGSVPTKIGSSHPDLQDLLD